MATFFTSDTHYFHKNIISYCNRPWNSMDDMITGLVDRWNSVVSPDDTVYHLGDVSFAGTQATKPILEALNGYKILVRGNHDPKASKCLNFGFNEVYEQLFINSQGQCFWLAHVPTVNDLDSRPLSRPELDPEIYHTPSARKSLIPLCGHVHSLWKYRNGCINVGVDVWDWTPVSVSQILECWKENHA